MFLSGEWSVRLRCSLRYRPEAQLARATHALVVPHAFTGTKEVVPLTKKELVRMRCSWRHASGPLMAIREVTCRPRNLLAPATGRRQCFCRL